VRAALATWSGLVVPSGPVFSCTEPGASNVGGPSRLFVEPHRNGSESHVWLSAQLQLKLQHGRDALTYQHDFHLTQLGHTVAARALADALDDSGFLPRP
jgi:hypothetical protein